MFSLCPFDISVGVGAFVIGLSQISSFLSSPIMSGFHGAFATGLACQQGTLTLPDTWFRPPLLNLLVETRFLELAMSLLDFSPRIHLVTFSILLIGCSRFTETDMPTNGPAYRHVQSNSPSFFHGGHTNYGLR